MEPRIALAVLPAELWMVVLELAPDLAAYGALVRTCAALAALGRDAALLKRIRMKYGIRHGFYRDYRPSNGDWLCTASYCNGRLDGDYESWHSHGTLAVKCYYREGKLHGKYESWYGNGRRKRECTYCEGELEGEVREYHDNGVLGEIYAYHYGTRGFRTCKYCRDGLLYEAVDGDGKLWLASYDEEGKCRGTASDRVRVDRFRIKPMQGAKPGWHEAPWPGAPWNGGGAAREMERERCRNRKGRLVRCCHRVDGALHGQYQEWHDNGRLGLQLSYVRGVREGKFRSWYNDGTRMQYGVYHHGKLVQIRYTYLP